MNVYDQAHGLAQAIKASEEYKQYDQAKKKIKDNEELENMIKDFQSKQFEMQADSLRLRIWPECSSFMPFSLMILWPPVI